MKVTVNLPELDLEYGPLRNLNRSQARVALQALTQDIVDRYGGIEYWDPDLLDQLIQAAADGTLKEFVGE